MVLRREVAGLYSAMLMNELRFMREFGMDVGYQTMLYMDLVRYSGCSTVGQLADVLSLDKSTVSRKVDSLVGKGLLVRERDPEDGRVVRLRPSESVEAMYDRADAPYLRASERLRSELTDEELAAVARAAVILTEELERRSWTSTRCTAGCPSGACS